MPPPSFPTQNNVETSGRFRGGACPPILGEKEKE